MSEYLEKYNIETEFDLKKVRDIVNKMFSETNSFLKGKFIGSMKNDTFYGSTNYNVHITIKGNIYQKEEKTFISMTISDCSPNYATIANTFVIIFLVIALIIIASNKSTDIFHYLIPIVIFGITMLGLKIFRMIIKYFKPSLKNSAELIAKEINGKIKNVG
jgi:hypothetical protein